MISTEERALINEFSEAHGVPEDEVFFWFQNLKETVVETWRSIVALFEKLNLWREQATDKTYKINNLRKTWHAPIDTTKDHQVLSKKPLFTRIRNQI